MKVLNRTAIIMLTIFALSLVCATGASEQKDTRGIASPSQTSQADNAAAMSWAGHESIKECHSCHEDAASDEPPLKAPVPQLCESCHTAFSDLPGRVHGPVATGQCMICHEPHQAARPSLLKRSTPDLCRQCHEAANLAQVKDHLAPAYAQCQVCHEAHAGPGRMLLKPEFTKAQEILGLLSSEAPTQTRSLGQTETLRGIEGVTVSTVIDRAKRVEAYGLTPALLQTLVKQWLHRHDIPVVAQDAQTDRTACLLVHLSLVEVPSPRTGQILAICGSLNLRLCQTAELPPLPGDETARACTATTWDTGSIVLWGARHSKQGLEQSLQVFLTRFAEAYKKVN